MYYTHIHTVLRDISTEISEVNKMQYSVLITKFIACSVNTAPWCNVFCVYSAMSTVKFQNHCLVDGMMSIGQRKKKENKLRGGRGGELKLARGTQ